MKEITITIPDDSAELVTELVEKLGGSIDKKERRIKLPKEKGKNISSNKKKGDPLALFGKYPDFPLDPETYRKDLWERNEEL